MAVNSQNASFFVLSRYRTTLLRVMFSLTRLLLWLKRGNSREIFTKSFPLSWTCKEKFGIKFGFPSSLMTHAKFSTLFKILVRFKIARWWKWAFSFRDVYIAFCVKSEITITSSRLFKYQSILKCQCNMMIKPRVFF